MNQELLNRGVNYKSYNHDLDSPHRVVSRHDNFSYSMVPLANMIGLNSSTRNRPIIASLLHRAQNSLATLFNDPFLLTHQDYNRSTEISPYRHRTQDRTASSIIVPVTAAARPYSKGTTEDSQVTTRPMVLPLKGSLAPRPSPSKKRTELSKPQEDIRSPRWTPHSYTINMLQPFDALAKIC